jgi:hypothetical protein
VVAASVGMMTTSEGALPGGDEVFDDARIGSSLCATGQAALGFLDDRGS